MINDIVTDGHTAFVSTENNGLLVIEGQGTKKRIKIAENGLGLALQPGEILWISTAKGNTLRYDLHRKTLHSMDRECGLNGNSIYNITTDRKGKLWILTRQTSRYSLLKTNIQYVARIVSSHRHGKLPLHVQR